jgi:hypothetical protein
MSQSYSHSQPEGISRKRKNQDDELLGGRLSDIPLNIRQSETSVAGGDGFSGGGSVAHTGGSFDTQSQLPPQHPSSSFRYRRSRSSGSAPNESQTNTHGVTLSNSTTSSPSDAASRTNTTATTTTTANVIESDITLRQRKKAIVKLNIPCAGCQIFIGGLCVYGQDDILSLNSSLYCSQCVSKHLPPLHSTRTHPSPSPSQSLSIHQHQHQQEPKSKQHKTKPKKIRTDSSETANFECTLCRRCVGRGSFQIQKLSTAAVAAAAPSMEGIIKQEGASMGPSGFSGSADSAAGAADGGDVGRGQVSVELKVDWHLFCTTCHNKYGA